MNLKPHFFLGAFLFMVLLIASSCRKEAILKSELYDQNINLQSRTSGPKSGNSTVLHTVLDTQKINPFALTKMNQANDSLYGVNAPNLTTTHKYYKFSPKM